MSEEWKIDKRRPGCSACARPFEGGETHVSGIVEEEGRFVRRDLCDGCRASHEAAFFSFWMTVAPRREERTLENVNAMVDFFRKLVSEPMEDPLRQKIVYLAALLLMRKKRLKAVGSRRGEGGPRLLLEKSWDGDSIDIAEPSIADDELERLKTEMEQLFAVDLAGAGA